MSLNNTIPPLSFNPPPGTRDWYPEDMAFRDWLFNTIRTSCGLYGFEEYDAPILEDARFWTEKEGGEITEQMFTYKGKDGEVLAVRPEMTPSLARLIMQREKTLKFPLKLFSIPNCWRNESIQKGRKREFFQLNCDIWGIKGPQGEAELFSLLVDLLEKLGFSSSQVQIKFSSRVFIEDLLRLEFGLELNTDQFKDICTVLDKIDKLTFDDLVLALNNKFPEIINVETSKKIVELVSFKLEDPVVSSMEKIEAFKELLTNEKLKSSKSFTDMLSLVKYCNSYGISNWITFDPTIFRGLSYYTGIVFEAFAKAEILKTVDNVKPANRAICGGGRYDEILSQYGYGKNINAVGFGMGDVVVYELLKDLELLPTFNRKVVDDFVVPFSEEYRNVAIQIVSNLRKQNRRADIWMVESNRLKPAYNYADSLGVILIAPDEWLKGEYVSVKYLKETNKDKKTRQMQISEL